MQLGLQGIPVVARTARRAVSGEGGDGPSRHQPYPLVAGVGDVDVSRCVDGHALRRIQLRAGRRTAVARESRLAVARDACDVATGVKAIDRMQGGEIKVPPRVS